jgi:hypothetical protein
MHPCSRGATMRAAGGYCSYYQPSTPLGKRTPRPSNNYLGSGGLQSAGAYGIPTTIEMFSALQPRSVELNWHSLTASQSEDYFLRRPSPSACQRTIQSSVGERSP